MMKDLFDPLKKVKENESCRVRKEKESEIQRAKFLKLIKNGNTEFKEEEEKKKTKSNFHVNKRHVLFFRLFPTSFPLMPRRDFYNHE